LTAVSTKHGAFELIGHDDSVKCYAAILDRETLVMLVETYEEGFDQHTVFRLGGHRLGRLI